MMKFKEWICWHKYKTKGQFYDIKIVNHKFKLTLREMFICVRCGKTCTKKVQVFEGLTLKELCKIKKLVQSHGALRGLI